MKYNKIGSVPYTHMTSVLYPTRNKRKQAIAVLHDMVYTALKGRRRPGGLQYCQKKKLKPEVVASTSGQIINIFIKF